MGRFMKAGYRNRHLERTLGCTIGSRVWSGEAPLAESSMGMEETTASETPPVTSCESYFATTHFLTCKTCKILQLLQSYL